MRDGAQVRLHGASVGATVLVANALGNSERLSPGQAHIMVNKLLASVQA